MNFKATLVLLVLALAIGGYVVGVEMKKPDPTPTPFGGRAAAQPVNVLDIQVGDLATIIVRGVDGRVILTRPPGGNWILTSPQTGEADQNRVDAVAQRLAPLTASREIANVAKMAEYGLESPKVFLSVTTKDNKTEEIAVGDRTPGDESYYVRRGTGTSVFLVSRLVVDDAVRFLTDSPLPKPSPAPRATP